MGVTLEENRYRVRVSKEGKRINLGSFDTELKAKRALNKWKRDQEMPFLPEADDPTTDFLGKPLQTKPSMIERVKNAYRTIRSSAGTKK